MKVRIHVDRLVLDGFALSPADRSRVQASFESELARLVAARGIETGVVSGLAVPSLPAADLQLPSRANPIDLGRRIAGAVHGALNPTPVDTGGTR